MENPFLNLSLGVPGNFGQTVLEGLHKEIIDYLIITEFSGLGHIIISRKDQFPDPESAFLCMVHRMSYHEDEFDRFKLIDYEPEDLVELAETRLLRIYGMRTFTDLSVEKFIEQYERMHDAATGFTTSFEDGKKRFFYHSYGLFRDEEEYGGNYRRFDPFLGLQFEKCYSIFDDEENKREYFGTTDRFYIFLTWSYKSLL